MSESTESEHTASTAAGLEQPAGQDVTSAGPGSEENAAGDVTSARSGSDEVVAQDPTSAASEFEDNRGQDAVAGSGKIADQQTSSEEPRWKKRARELWKWAHWLWNCIAVWSGRDPRWHEAEDWRHGRESDLSRPSDGGFHVPARACPRGHMHEAAKVELLSRASLSGQARLRAHFSFETETCTACGSKLIDRCGRCGARFVEPVEDRCRACGLPQPWSPDRLLSSTGARARRWRKGDSKDPAVLVRAIPGAGALYVIEGDITRLAVDCVVSNDDVDGRMYTVIASAIKAAAGADVERQSLSQGPFKRGEAWRTDAGTLPAPIKAVVHVAAMDRRGDTDRDAIRECVSHALDEARGMTSIGIAAFGTGPRGFGPKVIDIEDWLNDVAETVVARLLAWKKEAHTEGSAQPDAESTIPSATSSPSGAPTAVESKAAPEARTAPHLDVVVVLYEPLNFSVLVDCLTNAANAAGLSSRGTGADIPAAPRDTSTQDSGEASAGLT